MNLTLQNTLIMVNSNETVAGEMVNLSLISSAVIYMLILFITIRMLITFEKMSPPLQGAGVRWTPLPQAEAPTEPTGEKRVSPFFLGGSHNLPPKRASPLTNVDVRAKPSIKLDSDDIKLHKITNDFE